MSAVISFKCEHCGETIEAELEMRGEEAQCPGCSKTIIVPKEEFSADDFEALKTEYPDLQNQDEKGVLNTVGFLKEYCHEHCEKQPNEREYALLTSESYRNGIGKILAKRFETASFASMMQGSSRDRKKFNASLFGNKKLNKQINAVITGSGLSVKKHGLFGLFG